MIGTYVKQPTYKHRLAPPPTLMLMFLCCSMPCSRSSLFLFGALADAVGGLRSGSLRLRRGGGGRRRRSGNSSSSSKYWHEVHQ
jgi:hypothetical protein